MIIIRLDQFLYYYILFYEQTRKEIITPDGLLLYISFTILGLYEN